MTQVLQLSLICIGLTILHFTSDGLVIKNIIVNCTLKSIGKEFWPS